MPIKNELELKNLIDFINGPVLIFTKFRQEAIDIQSALKKQKVVIFSGWLTNDLTLENLHLADVIITTFGLGSIGWKAPKTIRHCIYYSNPRDNIDAIQSFARIYKYYENAFFWCWNKDHWYRGDNINKDIQLDMESMNYAT